MTTIALIGVTAFAVYLYITKRLERNRAENYKLLYETRGKKLEELQSEIARERTNAHYYESARFGEIQSVPRTERTVSSFAIAKLNLLKRFIDMNLIENERGSTPHRLPYAKESLTLEIKDNIDGTIGVYYDGVEVKPKDVSIINSFLEKTRDHGIRK